MSSTPKCIIVTGRPGSGKTTLSRRLNQYLAGEISVVIEAAFQHKVWEPRMPKILELATPFIVVCSVDGMVAAKRHLQRGLDDPNREFYHGDMRVAIYRETGEMSPPGDYAAPNFDVPTVHVSTELQYSPSMDDLVKRIRLLDARQGNALDASSAGSIDNR